MTTTLMPMGGALDERKDPAVLKEFLRLAGGRKARLVVLPQASARRDTGSEYVKMFRDFGAREVVSLESRSRFEAGSAEQARLIRKATGIFFSGGAQMRIAAIFGGTPLEAELFVAYRRGCVVGGTSAGASILSKTMVAYGRGGPTPREGMIHLSAGLGFTDKFLFDQHFRQCDRLGRLIYAIASHPGILGVGIDEDTAAVVENDSRLTVIGSGAVTIVDGHEMGGSDVAEVENGGPVAAPNLRVHVLTSGCVFDERTRAASLPLKPLLDE